MNIITSLNIDLIEPFPEKEIPRAFGWFHAYRNIVECDVSPKTPEEFAERLRTTLSTPGARSFGVIDKYNQLNFRHEAPLVGIIIYEPAPPWNAYIHLASGRRAWGSYFMDEAIQASLDHLFSTLPDLLRVSALVMPNNGPVKGLARRLGWAFEGRLRDMVLRNGEPCDLLHFGFTRKMWEDSKHPPTEPPPTDEGGEAGGEQKANTSEVVENQPTSPNTPNETPQT